MALIITKTRKNEMAKEDLDCIFLSVFPLFVFS